MTEERVEQISANWEGRQGALLGLLQEIQSEFNHVPPEALSVVAQRLRVPLSQVYGVTTFYNSFSLEPRGKHTVTCCLGTACHVRGGQRIANEVQRVLGVEPGQTTEDGEFTFETVRCLGSCALAPVVMIDGRYHSKVTARKLRKLLRDTRAKENGS